MSTAPALDALPAAVRARVVGLAASALPDVVRLPPALRRVADFAPARRARVGGGAIASALGEDDLRERVGSQVAARVAPSARADAAEVAAYVWLVRPDGWAETLARATEELAEAPDDAAREEVELARLRERLERAERTVRDLRATHRAEVSGHKSDIATLRRSLGEARGAVRAARAEAEDAVREAEEARAGAEALAAGQDKELRRLRGQVAQLEAELTAGRRSVRGEREEATVRARMLLDTVLEAAGGLQRELGLPPVTGSPADRVEQDVARAGAPPAGAAVTPEGGGPGRLERYLSLPRARLVVDGYNVTKTAWPDSPLEVQRARLVTALAPLVARTGAETTVVFDAASVTSRPPVTAPRGVRVLFSPPGVIADDVIRDLVAAEPEGRVVVVVTSDQAVVGDVARAGARTVPASALLALLARVP